MTRKYNPKIVEKNVRIFSSPQGILEQVANSPETLNILEGGKRKYHYFISFTYDTQKGDIIACGAEIPNRLVKDFNQGLIGRAWIEVEKQTDELRIRKFIGFDRALKLINLGNGKEYFVSGVRDKNAVQNVKEASQDSRDTLLETILHYNHLQRRRRKQGVNQ